jgi:segregation and condensation protein B
VARGGGFDETPECCPVTDPAANYSTLPPSASENEAPLDLSARLEALLFVSSGPVAPARLAEVLGRPTAEIEEGLLRLEASLARRGLRVQRHGGGVQLTTSPLAAADVERFLNLESSVHLTRAALETLAIIAYRQPVTRPLVDSIRGVNSETSLHTLLRYGLVEETGRGEGPGRPILYATTQDFLQNFGLSSLAELAPIDEPEAARAGDGIPAGAHD